MANQSHVTSSTSFQKAINLKQTAIYVTTGDGSYAVSGMLSTDVILDAAGFYVSNATTTSYGAINATTFSNSGKTGSVALAGTVSTGIVYLSWLDVSA